MDGLKSKDEAFSDRKMQNVGKAFQLSSFYLVHLLKLQMTSSGDVPSYFFHKEECLFKKAPSKIAITGGKKCSLFQDLSFCKILIRYFKRLKIVRKF